MSYDTIVELDAGRERGEIDLGKKLGETLTLRRGWTTARGHGVKLACYHRYMVIEKGGGLLLIPASNLAPVGDTVAEEEPPV